MDAIGSDTVLIFTNDGMGNTEHRELRHRLAKTYLTMLLDNSYLPAAVCFYTDGVRLVCRNSPVLDELRQLAELGVMLIVCKTCIDFLDLVEERQVGIVGGMADIIEAQWRAGKVVAL